MFWNLLQNFARCVAKTCSQEGGRQSIIGGVSQSCGVPHFTSGDALTSRTISSRPPRSNRSSHDCPILHSCLTTSQTSPPGPNDGTHEDSTPSTCEESENANNSNQVKTRKNPYFRGVLVARRDDCKAASAQSRSRVLGPEARFSDHPCATPQHVLPLPHLSAASMERLWNLYIGDWALFKLCDVINFGDRAK